MNTPQYFEDLQNIHDDNNNPALPGLVHSNHPVYPIRYVAHKTQDRLVKALLKQPKIFWRFLKKHWWKTFITGAFLAYMFSPEIWYFKNQWKRIKSDDKTKKEFWLDSVYQTTDWETNTIVKLVSWVAHKEDVDSLSSLYWHKQAFDTMYANTPQDTLMYTCLVTIFMELHNPHTSFDGDYKRDILGDALWYDYWHVNAKVDEFKANMQIANIRSTGVFSDTTSLYHTMDSTATAEGRKLLPADITKKIHELNRSWARYIVDKIVAELWHIRWLHRDGLIRYYMDYLWNYVKGSFQQKNLYDKPWTEEYETHSVDNWRWQWEEWIIIAKFLKLYEENMPKDSKRHTVRLASFYNWFFENYQDLVKAWFYIQKAEKMK